jgi:hypothetical protein
MRVTLQVLAVLMLAMGIIWVLQGVNILPGSFMTGQMVWAYRGAATALAGVVILLLLWRRAKRR